MKITLFFAAGNYAETLGIHKVSEMDGVGRRMPGTTLAFTVGALGMIGIPPVAGFVSKWYLGLGAVEAGAAAWVLPVLVASSLLNAAYFLPILYRAWFSDAPGAWPAERRDSGRSGDARAPALAAGGHRRTGAGGRAVCRRPLQSAGVGRTDRGAGVSTMNGTLLILAWLTPLLALAFVFTRFGGPGGRRLRHCRRCCGHRWYPPVPASTSPGCCSERASDWTPMPLYSCCFRRCCGCWPRPILPHRHKSMPMRSRFRIFFLLAMSGNFALILGQDLVSFYLGFALMGLAAYGLVVHDGNDGRPGVPAVSTW